MLQFTNFNNKHKLRIKDDFEKTEINLILNYNQNIKVK